MIVWCPNYYLPYRSKNWNHSGKGIQVVILLLKYLFLVPLLTTFPYLNQPLMTKDADNLIIEFYSYVPLIYFLLLLPLLIM